MKTELEKFYALVEDMEIAMMTTRRSDGHLRSRAMATQKRAEGADLWFVTCQGTPKLRDLAQDPHVNLSYYNDSKREWVSVSGTAVVSEDRAKIRELMKSTGSSGSMRRETRHGTPEDPRMVLIGVTVHAAEFLEINKPSPVILPEMVKGWLTGDEPSGEMHKITEPRRSNVRS